MNHRLLAVLSLPCLAACEALSEVAPGTLDASFAPTEVYSHAGVGGNTERGQGFTAQNSGTLIQVDLWLKGATQSADLHVFVLPVDEEGAPVSEEEALDHAVIAGGLVPEEEVWQAVAFDGAAQLVAGEQYAWTVSSPDEDGWNYGLLGGQALEDGTTYDEGDPCERVVGNYEWKSCHNGGDGDEGFKVWLEEE